MEDAIRARQAKGEYDAVTSGREFAKVLTEHLREVCKDKHLRVSFDSEPAPKDRPDRPSAEQMQRMRGSRPCGTTGSRRSSGSTAAVGLLELENFMPAEMIGDTAAAAMSFLANSEAVIVDLRKNGGGDPAAVILLCSYFFDDQTHLNSIYNRSQDTTRQYWSHPAVPGKKLTGKDLYVLTSNRTFSGAEEFAYNMQSQKRATIIGETTGGGAHPTRGFRVTDHFGVGVPFARSINPVTKTNWEGTGVKPDVAVPADQALLTAHLHGPQEGPGEERRRQGHGGQLQAGDRREGEGTRRPQGEAADGGAGRTVAERTASPQRSRGPERNGSPWLRVLVRASPRGPKSRPAVADTSS